MGEERLKSVVDDIEIENLSDEEYVKLAYLALLQRRIDDVGLGYWRTRIKEGGFNRKDLIDTLRSSPEFVIRYKIPFHEMIHRARVEWCRGLEKFETILDIGGSSANTEMGALIELGYSHRPRELVIFDLPPAEQYWGSPKFSQERNYNYNWGMVRYVHGDIEDAGSLRVIEAERFDCIFMGQVIEHIQKSSVEALLGWIRRHLKEGGKFVFDTPNRDITRIQSPDKLIDEDHKYEYTPAEMEGILERNGFRVVRKTGIVEMPGTLQTKSFNPLEAYETRPANDKPDESYIFAFECAKA